MAFGNSFLRVAIKCLAGGAGRAAVAGQRASGKGVGQAVAVCGAANTAVDDGRVAEAFDREPSPVPV